MLQCTKTTFIQTCIFTFVVWVWERPSPDPAWMWLCAQSKIQKGMVWWVWCEGIPVACADPDLNTSEHLWDELEPWLRARLSQYNWMDTKYGLTLKPSQMSWTCCGFGGIRVNRSGDKSMLMSMVLEGDILRVISAFSFLCDNLPWTPLAHFFPSVRKETQTIKEACRSLAVTLGVFVTLRILWHAIALWSV